jgi:hypothetical protein
MKPGLKPWMMAVGFIAGAALAGPPQTLDVEGGWVFPGYNDVRVPGDSGTKLSLTEDLSADAFPAWRARYLATLAGRHELGALAALLTLHSDGTVGRRVDFNGASLPAGTPLESCTVSRSRLCPWPATPKRLPLLPRRLGGLTAGGLWNKCPAPCCRRR